jgi:nitric oxide reductase NorQ protein
VAEGLALPAAARAAVAGPLSDDPIVTAGLFEMIDAYTGGDPAGLT